MEQAKGNAVSGTTLAQYVHDAVEVERPIRELEGQIEELKHQLDEKTAQIEREIAGERATKKAMLDSSLKHEPKMRPKEVEPSIYQIEQMAIKERAKLIRVGLWIAAAMISPMIGILVFLRMVPHLNSSSEGLGFGLSVIFGPLAVVLIIFGIRFSVAKKKSIDITRRKIRARLDQNNFEIEKENRCTLAGWEKHNKQLAAELENIDELEKTRKQELADGAEKIKELESQLSGLQAGREKFYEAGLIPPDYRTFEHVSGLDAIFRNGRADDMRQALEIYEETLFREEIKQAASRMQGSISAIYINLNSVGRRLDDLKGALAGVSESNRQAAELNKRMLYETQMNRAAAEELRRNSEEAMRYASEAQRAAREEAEKNDKLRRQISDAQWEAREEARKNDELRRKISDHLDDN